MTLRQTTAQPSVEVNEFFLSICWGPEPQRRVYFYAAHDTAGEPLVRRICTLFTREYGGASSHSGQRLRFEYTPVGDLSDDDAFLVRDAIEAFAESARPTRHPCGEDDLTDLLSLRGGTARRMIGRILFHQAQRWAEKVRRQAEKVSRDTGPKGRSDCPPRPGKPAVEPGAPGDPCRVLGKEKKPLTDAQYAVITRLLKAGPAGLSKDALEAVRPSARRILRNLRKDKDWAKVIRMPGQTNGRYRLKA